MTSRFITPVYHPQSRIGLVMPGAKLYFYEVGSSTTFKDTFADREEQVKNSNPVIANGAGVFPDIYGSGEYRVVLEWGGVQQWERDNVTWADVSSSISSFPTKDDVKSGTTTSGEVISPEIGQLLFTEGYDSIVDGGHAGYVVFPPDTFTVDDILYLQLDNGNQAQRLKIPTQNFDTIEEAIAAGWLGIGDTAKIKTRPIPYSVVENGTGTDDGGKYIDLDNGNQLEILNTSFVTFDQYGAVGDGSTNDSTQIQAAVDGFENIQGVEGKIYVCGNVTVPSNTQIKNASFLSLDNLGENESIFQTSESENIAFENLNIDGNSGAQTASIVNALNLSGSNITVKNCEIYNTTWNAVTGIPPFDNSFVLDNYLHDLGGRGFTHNLDLLETSSNTIISRNTIINCGSTGISLLAGEEATDTPSAGVIDWIIDSNTVKNCGLTVVAGGIGGYSSNNIRLTISNNIIENVTNHMHHVGGQDVKVVGNTGKNIANIGVLARNFPNSGTGDGAPLMSGAVISNNHISTVSGTGTNINGGIVLANCDEFTVSGNRIDDVFNQGIYVQGLALNRDIRCENGTIVGNSISNAGASMGISDQAEGILLTDADKITISGNSVNASYQSCIKVKGCEHVTISGNSATDSVTNNGIQVSEIADGGITSQNIDISGNVATGNSQFGIRVDDNVIRATVVGNGSNGNTTGQVFLGSIVSSLVRCNTGRRDYNGMISNVANGGTIPHFLEDTPTRYSIIPTVPNRAVAITGVDATNLTVSLQDLDGNLIAVAEPVVWEASAEIT